MGEGTRKRCERGGGRLWFCPRRKGRRGRRGRVGGGGGVVPGRTFFEMWGAERLAVNEMSVAFVISHTCLLDPFQKDTSKRGFITTWSREMSTNLHPQCNDICFTIQQYLLVQEQSMQSMIINGWC